MASIADDLRAEAAQLRRHAARAWSLENRAILEKRAAEREAKAAQLEGGDCEPD